MRFSRETRVCTGVSSSTATMGLLVVPASSEQGCRFANRFVFDLIARVTSSVEDTTQPLLWALVYTP